MIALSLRVSSAICLRHQAPASTPLKAARRCGRSRMQGPHSEHPEKPLQRCYSAYDRGPTYGMQSLSETRCFAGTGYWLQTTSQAVTGPKPPHSGHLGCVACTSSPSHACEETPDSCSAARANLVYYRHHDLFDRFSALWYMRGNCRRTVLCFLLLNYFQEIKS